MNPSSILLVCQADKETGLGHLTRIISLIEEIISTNNFSFKLLVFGDESLKNRISDYNYSIESNIGLFQETITNECSKKKYSLVLFDLCPRKLPSKLEETLNLLNQNNTKLISIDSLFKHHGLMEFIWVPSFYYSFSQEPQLSKKIESGWDTFLLNKKLNHTNWKKGKKLLVLTGASDNQKLSEILPDELNGKLLDDIEINWVKGPFSMRPRIPFNSKHEWKVHDSPESLDYLIRDSNFILTVFGVSFFEALQYGIPSVVFSPYGIKDHEELNALSQERVAIVSEDYSTIVNDLNNLISSEDLARRLSLNALKKMEVNGVKRLVKKIISTINK